MRKGRGEELSEGRRGLEERLAGFGQSINVAVRWQQSSVWVQKIMISVQAPTGLLFSGKGCASEEDSICRKTIEVD